MESEDKLTQRVNSMLIWGAVGGLSTFIGGILGMCQLDKNKVDLPLADQTPIVREFPSFSIHHNSFDGLYLTVEESQYKKDNGRQIILYDYGFDGKIDEIKILQGGRRNYITTNRTELVNWQPIFEKMRDKRFGEFSSRLIY
jgi:hypothetical protein